MASSIITISSMYLVYMYGLYAISFLFWLKIFTLGIIILFINSYKKNEFYYYQNLGLSKLFFGQLIPNDKSIRVNGKYHLHKHFPKDVITYLPQFGFIPKSLTINSVFKDYEIDADRFYHYFPEFRKLNKSKIKHLSGGEHRVIEIYIILVSKSQFCMLDEPFSQVMPRHIDAIKEIIINEKKHKGILISDHLYEHIIDVCDDVNVIRDGTLVLIDDVMDIERLGYAKINRII